MRHLKLLLMSHSEYTVFTGIIYLIQVEPSGPTKESPDQSNFVSDFRSLEFAKELLIFAPSNNSAFWSFAVLL